jgi:hypothetical protein
VREAAAIASPDELRGNVVKAFVVLAPDREPSDELAEEIKRFVRDRLSAYAARGASSSSTCCRRRSLARSDASCSVSSSSNERRAYAASGTATPASP